METRQHVQEAVAAHLCHFCFLMAFDVPQLAHVATPMEVLLAVVT
jgi:hypothetical protein